MLHEDSGIVGIGIAKAWCDTSEKGFPWRQAHCPLWCALRSHHLGMGTAKLAWFLTVLILYLFEPCWRLIFVLQQQLWWWLPKNAILRPKHSETMPLACWGEGCGTRHQCHSAPFDKRHKRDDAHGIYPLNGMQISAQPVMWENR